MASEVRRPLEAISELGRLEGKALLYDRQCRYLIQRCLAVKSIIKFAEENPARCTIDAPQLENVWDSLAACKVFCSRFSNMSWFGANHLAYTEDHEFLYLHCIVDLAIKAFDHNKEFSALLLDLMKADRAAVEDRAALKAEVLALIQRAPSTGNAFTLTSSETVRELLTARLIASKYLLHGCEGLQPVPEIPAAALTVAVDSLAITSGGETITAGTYHQSPVSIKRFAAGTIKAEDSALMKELHILSACATLGALVGVVGYDVTTPALILEPILCTLQQALHNRAHVQPSLPKGIDLDALMYEKVGVLLDLLSALELLHEHRIIHGRIMSSNILLIKGQPNSDETEGYSWHAKLGDFGLHALRDEAASAIVKAAYTAPEDLAHDEDRPPTMAGDVFALTTLANEVLSEREPWKGLPRSEICMNVCIKEMRPERWSPANAGNPEQAFLAEWIGDSTRGGWHQDPAQRPTAGVLVAANRRAHLPGSAVANVLAVRAARTEAIMADLLVDISVLDPVSCVEEQDNEAADSDGEKDDLNTSGANDPVLYVPPTPGADNEVVVPAEGESTPPKPTGPVVTGAETGHPEHSAASVVSPNTTHTAAYSTQEEYEAPLVIDFGTSNCRVGFAGDDSARIHLQSCHKTVKGHLETSIKLGQEFNWKARYGWPSWSRHYPLLDGVIQDFDAYEMYLREVFAKEMRVDPHDQPILCTSSILCPGSEYERKIQVMMESFSAPAYQCCTEPWLAPLSAGEDTCLSVTIGGGLVQILPRSSLSVFKEYGRTMLGVAGECMTEHMKRLVSHESGELYRAQAVMLKEDLCYVALDGLRAPVQEKACTKDLEYWDSYIHSLTLGRERFLIPEALFQPTLSNGSNDIPGLSEQVQAVIASMHEDAKRVMYGNIVITGGGSKLLGIAARLENDLKRYVPLGCKVNVTAPSARHYGKEESAWIGASIWADKQKLQSAFWISRAEYDEVGSSMVHRKPTY